MYSMEFNYWLTSRQTIIVACKPAAGNRKSASENSEVVDKYLANEREAVIQLAHWLRRKQRGADQPILSYPKKPLTRQIETYLSSILTKGGSVNDEISQQLCSLAYLAVNDMAKVALHLGQ